MQDSVEIDLETEAVTGGRASRDGYYFVVLTEGCYEAEVVSYGITGRATADFAICSLDGSAADGGVADAGH